MAETAVAGNPDGAPADVPPVEIALATYKGERFLRPLLRSIADQSYPDIRIVASDDRSPDGTVEMLRGFHERPVDVAENTGPRGFSFNFNAALLRTTAPYVLLADQDDVWMPDKVARMVAAARATEARAGPDAAVLVFSDLQVVDEQLGLIRPGYFPEGAAAIAAFGFADHLHGSRVPGCAMLLNRALLDRALPVPAEVPLHDWWFALVAAGFGTVAAVPEALIQYRQHGGNQLGAPPSTARGQAGRFRSPVSHVRARLGAYRQAARLMTVMLRAMQTRFADQLPPDRRRILDQLLTGSRLVNLVRFRHARATGGRLARPALTLLRPRAAQSTSGTSQ